MELIKIISYFSFIMIFGIFCHESMHIILQINEPAEVCFFGLNPYSLRLNSAIGWVIPTKFNGQINEFIPTLIGFLGSTLVLLSVFMNEYVNVHSTS